MARLSLICRPLLLLVACALSGCSPPLTRPAVDSGLSTPADPQVTVWGKHFAVLQAGHPGLSGLHVLQAGVDGIAVRLQLVRQAERTLDLQYFIYRGDLTGGLLTAELQRAAERGVRVRVLVDDGDTVAGDERILTLDGYRQIEVRVFNPFDYRGHNRVLRNLDFVLHKSRLDYRMHNKLLVADGSVALIGGRNVGDQYFQVDPDSQFADDDVFTVGAAVPKLSRSFEEFWQSDRVVPASSLRRYEGRHAQSHSVLSNDMLARINGREPLQSLLSDPGMLTWANSTVLYDSPDKAAVRRNAQRGQLISDTVERQIELTRRDLAIVSPYFVPSDRELEVLHDARGRDVTVRILTNSLESTSEVAAHSGYRKAREPMLRSGVRLFETRALLDSTRGSGQGRQISRYGNYALHGKMYVFDKSRVLVGSWNYDQRSLRLNTEIALLIESPDVAGQVLHRLDAMTSPEAAYEVVLSTASTGRSHLIWKTTINQVNREYTTEPSRGWWRRWKAWWLSLLPLEPEL